MTSRDKERIATLKWWVAWLLARDAAMVGYQYGEAISREHARRLGVGRLFEDLLARDSSWRYQRMSRLLAGKA